MFWPYPEILFEQRRGVVIERFGGWLPRLKAIGFADGEPRKMRLGIGFVSDEETDAGTAHPPEGYAASEIAEFEELRGLLRRAIAEQDVKLTGEVSSRSAEINQAFLPKPSFDIILDLLRDSGAVGLSASHSGSGVALLFDPRKDEYDGHLLRAEHLLDEAGFHQRWSFTTGSPS
jgi:uncharacterized protein involved in propanediol utilization